MVLTIIRTRAGNTYIYTLLKLKLYLILDIPLFRCKFYQDGLNRNLTVFSY